MAIPDWTVKKTVVKTLLQCTQDDEVVNLVCNDAGLLEKMRGVSKESLVTHYRYEWKKSSYKLSEGSKYLIFFSTLAAFLNCREQRPGNSLAFLSLTEFLMTLPVDEIKKLKIACEEGAFLGETEKIQNALEEIYFKNQELQHSEGSESPFLQIKVFQSEDSLLLLKDGISKRNIDQSLYYQRPESSELWLSITSDPIYTGTNQCQTALSRLCASESWENYIRQEDFCGIAMLGGGGSFYKDCVILQSLIERLEDLGRSASPIVYSLLDISYFMLADSGHKLQRKIQEEEIEQNVKLNPIVCDVLKFSASGDYRALRNTEDGRLSWFLTGGTLGNFDEIQFFRSLANVAKAGDRLIIGIEIAGTPLSENYCRKLLRKYNNGPVKKLISVPLEAIKSGLRSEDSFEDVAESMELSLITENDWRLSKVRNSISVVASINTNAYGRITLFKSTRYTEESLIEFAMEFGWQINGIFDGIDSSFKQLVFELH